MPFLESDLDAWIIDEHLSLTGKELTINSNVFVEEFDRGGMSSGYIFGEWWFDIGIPILKERLRNLQ